MPFGPTTTIEHRQGRAALAPWPSAARPYKPRGAGGVPSRPCAPIRWPPGRRGSNRRLRVGFESFGIDRAPRCGKRIISNVSFATRMNCSGFASTFSRTLHAGNWIGRILRRDRGPKRNGPGTPKKRRAEWHSAGVVGPAALAHAGRTLSFVVGASRAGPRGPNAVRPYPAFPRRSTLIAEALRYPLLNSFRPLINRVINIIQLIAHQRWITLTTNPPRSTIPSGALTGATIDGGHTPQRP